jgi:hypothetical protein
MAAVARFYPNSLNSKLKDPGSLENQQPTTSNVASAEEASLGRLPITGYCPADTSSRVCSDEWPSDDNSTVLL